MGPLGTRIMVDLRELRSDLYGGIIVGLTIDL